MPPSLSFLTYTMGRITSHPEGRLEYESNEMYALWKAVVAWLTCLCFEINSIKHRTSSYIISEASFGSDAMWPEVNSLRDSQEKSSCSSHLCLSGIWDYPFIPSASVPDQRSNYWEVQYMLSDPRTAVPAHVLFVLLQLIWDWNVRSHPTPTQNTDFPLTGRRMSTGPYSQLP